MGARRRTAQERRASLYKWAYDELGFTEAKAREILVASGEEKFNEELIPHYRALLKAAKGKIDRVGERLEEMNRQWQESREALQCPIPGCDGTLRRRYRSEAGHNPTCTVGGDRHPIVWRIAEIAVQSGQSEGMSHVEMVEHMLSERRNSEQEQPDEETGPTLSRTESGT